MKTRKNKAVKALRKILGKTQAEFAVMIGVSKPTVIAWENGQNRLEERAALRIESATGVDHADLLKGQETIHFWNGSKYDTSSFAAWRVHPASGGRRDPAEVATWLASAYGGRTKPETWMGLAEEIVKRDTGPERAAEVWAQQGAEILEAIFLEAAKPRGKVVNRLPAVRVSFEQWALDTCKAFLLRVPNMDFRSIKRPESRSTSPNPTTVPKDQI